jgi:AraC-like DNA-binding protein
MSTIPTRLPRGLSFSFGCPIESENAGLFVSRGVGRHPDRVISSYEVIFVVKGELRLAEEDREFSVGPGEYLILVPETRHWGSEDFPDELEFYWLHFRRTVGSRPGRTGRISLDFPRQGRVGDPSRLLELFRWFLDAQEKQRLEPKSANMLCLLILFEIDRRDSLAPADDERVPLVAREAKRLISRSFQSGIATSLVARELLCNPDYLGRVYKRCFGLSIMEDIHAHRIRLAKRLLLDENNNVNEVSGECGYGNVVYFRRLFKRSEGMSPNAFRKLYSHMHINST